MERIRNYGGAGRGGGVYRTTSANPSSLSRNNKRRFRQPKEKGRQSRKRNRDRGRNGKKKGEKERDVGRGDSVYDDGSNGEADSLELFFLSALPTDIFTGTINVIDAHRFNDHSLSLILPLPSSYPFLSLPTFTSRSYTYFIALRNTAALSGRRRGASALFTPC